MLIFRYGLEVRTSDTRLLKSRGATELTERFSSSLDGQEPASAQSGIQGYVGLVIANLHRFALANRPGRRTSHRSGRMRMRRLS